MKIAILLGASLMIGVMIMNPSFAQDDQGAKEALMEADRVFARETAARGGDGWADFFLKEGVMFPPQGKIEGQDAIRERMKAAFVPENPRLIWDPTEAHVAASGDLGYTVGRWKSLTAASDGQDSTLAEGNYVSIWKKTPDGEWRVALDIGNADPE